MKYRGWGKWKSCQSRVRVLRTRHKWRELLIVYVQVCQKSAIGRLVARNIQAEGANEQKGKSKWREDTYIYGNHHMKKSEWSKYNNDRSVRDMWKLGGDMYRRWTYGELPTAPMVWLAISIWRIRIAIPSAAVVKAILMTRNSYETWGRVTGWEDRRVATD